MLQYSIEKVCRNVVVFAFCCVCMKSVLWLYLCIVDWVDCDNDRYATSLALVILIYFAKTTAMAK